MIHESPHQQVSVSDSKIREYEETLSRLKGELDLSRSEAIRDSETALFSAAYFNARLQEEILRSERYRHFLSLILVHVDLKHVGTSGQLMHAMRQIGQELTSGLTRRTDIIALYRKRQMIIMLPETDAKGAHLLVSRYETMFPNNGRRLSYCVLTYPNDASNIEMVISRIKEASENLFLQTNP